ncbi:MAG: acyltransferase [Christensenellales bacterium]
MYDINSKGWIISTFYNCLARTAVPLFFFVSGGLYLNEEKEITYKKIFLTILRFVVIFFIWDLIYNVFDQLVINRSKINTNTIINIIQGLINYKYHLWFLPSYIYLIALTPLLRLICKKENRKHVTYLIIIFVVGTCFYKFFEFLISFGNFKHLSFLIRFFDLVNFGDISSNVILFISGWYFFTFDFSDKKKLINIFLIIISIITPIITILYCIYFNTLNAFNIAANYFYLPCYFLTVLIFLKFKYSDVANKKNESLKRLSSNTFGIYLCHVLFLDLVFKIFKSTILTYANTFWMILIIPICALAIYICSNLLSLILNFLPKKIRKWIC